MALRRAPATVQTRPEPMNSSSSHPKVKLSLSLSDPVYVAGTSISGKLEMECKAESGLGIGTMMVEFFAIQELTSRDHSATSTFLHSRRLFQGPGLPPSNAVLPHPIPGDPPLPQHYHQAKRGQTTFFFRIPIPSTSPSSINFGDGLACVRYEVRATVGVAWKGDRRLVTNKKSVDVVECYEEDDFIRIEAEGVLVGENGKIWVQGKVVGGIVVAGETACVELQVKNHSAKKTTGLQLTLTRHLYLPNVPPSEKIPLRITDNLTTVAFRGPEYIVHPGTEGVASLVFDVPRNARSVKGGPREGDEDEDKLTECLFEVKCTLTIKVGLPLGSKDISLDLPVSILHPYAVPQLPASPEQFAVPDAHAIPEQILSPSPMTPQPYIDRVQSPYGYPPLPMSPPLQQPFLNYTGDPQIWASRPLPQTHVPNPYQDFSPPFAGQQYYFPPLPGAQPLFAIPPRSSSAEPHASQALHELPSGLPDSINKQPPSQHIMPPLDISADRPVTPEEGKGERASRIAHHLRLSSRHRSVSPQSHRFPLPMATATVSSMRNLPPQPAASGSPIHLSPTGFSIPPQGDDGVLHSPRPMLSPKHSYTIDPMTHATLPKSERVEKLERMADEVAHQKNDLSDDLPKEPMFENNKTLPKLPATPRVLSPPSGRIDDIFASTATRQSVLRPVSEEAPPTPTLAPFANRRAGMGLGADLGQGRSENGLDALERKLLAEVGTRKLDKDDRRADVRNVLPIPIASPAAEPLNDSAISSLALAGYLDDPDSDGKTHHAGRQSHSDDGRALIPRRHHNDSASDQREEPTGKDKDKRTGRKMERGKDDEAHRLRKSAKGRVAEWLGGIDPDVPPEISPSLLPSVSKDQVIAAAGPEEDVRAVAKDLLEESSEELGSIIKLANISPENDEQSVPNPRSSGFVPIGTLKNYDTRRRSAIRAHNSNREGAGPKVVISQLPHPQVPQSPKVERINVSPLSDPLSSGSPTKRPELLSSTALRLPSFPQQPIDQEVKYNIRSARGGRGGRVTAVASIWASQGVDAESTVISPSPQKPKSNTPTQPSKKPTKTPKSSTSPAPPATLADLTARRTKMTKSSSVPAVVSSSHAMPTLSSTASLARSPQHLDRRKAPIKVSPAVSETLQAETETISDVKPVKPTQIAGDFAFGQARLRDLIKKYQGAGPS